MQLCIYVGWFILRLFRSNVKIWQLCWTAKDNWWSRDFFFRNILHVLRESSFVTSVKERGARNDKRAERSQYTCHDRPWCQDGIHEDAHEWLWGETGSQSSHCKYCTSLSKCTVYMYCHVMFGSCKHVTDLVFSNSTSYRNIWPIFKSLKWIEIFFF